MSYQKFKKKYSNIKNINYFLYLPQDYYNKYEKKWPTIIYLHGSGNIGNIKSLKDEGLPFILNKKK